MPQDIFISYRRRGASFFASKLRDRLEQSFPGQVFLDVSDIAAGGNFVTDLRRAVTASKVMIAVIGPDWATNSYGRTRLGDKDDYVTEEIATALEARIPVIPVLIEGTRMPEAGALPDRLRALATQAALAISHERFDTDASHLVGALYQRLGLAPPGRMERILELAGGNTRINQRTRDQFALWGLGLSLVAALLIGLWFKVNAGDPLEGGGGAMLGALALLLGYLGRHSVLRRWPARIAICTSIAVLIAYFGIGAWRVLSMPREPWMESVDTAQTHRTQDEIPTDKVQWTTRVPFMTPAPTVECDCLRITEQPEHRIPFPEGAHFTFTNQCASQVTFVLSKSRQRTFATAYPWFAVSGREFAIVTLLPSQRVRLSYAGVYAAQYQPWICAQVPRG